MSEEKIADFLVRLSSNQRLLDRYLKNPKAVLDKTRLSKRKKAILKSNDVERIREAIFDEVGHYFALGIIKCPTIIK